MPQTAIKICGLQSVEVIKSILPLQVDMIGFVFAASRRQVQPSAVRQMLAAVKEWGSLNKELRQPKAVGVFVNPSLEELGSVLREAELDVVQLHGQESPDFCRRVKEQFSVEVIKVLSMKKGNDTEPAESGYQADNSSEPTQGHQTHQADQAHQTNQAHQTSQAEKLLQPYLGAVDAVLLDTYDPIYGGGSGVAFDWTLIRPYQDWAQARQLPLMIAGGLNEENVGRLVSGYLPDGVDVSSGVERNGVKDTALIKAFVERVRDYDDKE
ncbi:phosphoribosylanthranilate isomerase [Paenibacillus pinistramenti]|uniref:phosphoribosylanthranilate isomerase n=1 Tax=Paenibacillus pinistramenti TaxID=1768003 RepID=UPI0011099C4D|nr:phosphoribosylanthranilate isomerase [Paenibacillus pinistramenti]